MFRRFAIVVGLLFAAAPARGGAVLTKTGEARVGPMRKVGEVVQLKVKFGVIKYKRGTTRWYTISSKVRTFLQAARAAFRDRDLVAAEAFLKESLKQEPDTKAEAMSLLTSLKRRQTVAGSPNYRVAADDAAAAVRPQPTGRIRLQFPDPSLRRKEVLDGTPGKRRIYQSRHSDYKGGRFGVYVPKRYSPEDPIPLVVSSHGAGGSGPGELGGWQGQADKYGFIVICPSYKIAGQGGSSLRELRRRVAEDDRMLSDIMKRAFGSFHIDRKHVLHTGFSGGGVPTWYIAMNHPEWFTALCFRSGNFYGEFMPLKDATWRNRPIYIFWGTKDHPIILKKSPVFRNAGEGPKALEFLEKRVRATKLKKEILDGGGHASRADLAAKWFAEEVVKTEE